MAQFPFQNAILKMESKKTGRVLRGALCFWPTKPPIPKRPPPTAKADPSALRRQITDLVAQNAVSMVQNAIDAVNEEGQYQAIKYLFEMVGLYPAAAGDDSQVEDSLLKTLLHHLGLAEKALPETASATASGTSTASDLLE
jgi:hypothetical protein